MRSTATLDYSPNNVDPTVCMTVAEQNGNRTALSGCGVEYVFTTESERVIEGVFGDLQAYVTYTHGGQADATKPGARGGPVSKWSFSGFGGNSGVRREIQVAVQLNKLRIVSTAPDGCVSAIAYAEAKRMNSLSAETIRRLDSQLRGVEPDILKLRPRFASRGS